MSCLPNHHVPLQRNGVDCVRNAVKNSVVLLYCIRFYHGVTGELIGKFLRPATVLNDVASDKEVFVS
jgi:hypothetical protein